MDNNLFDLRKALDTSTTNNNNVLDPVLLSKIISEQARRIPALRNIIKRIPWGTNIYTWDTITDPGVAQTAADGATLTLNDAAFSQSQAKMSYFYSVGYITNPAIKAAEELVDVVSMRLSDMTKSVLRAENLALYNGDAGNAQNPGLISAINAGPNSGVVGANATADSSLFRYMDMSLRGEGFEPGAFVVTPNVYGLLSDAAFNHVRFLGVNEAAQVGFQLMNNAISIHGIPVVMDKYAESVTAVNNVSMVLVSGNTYKFSADGTNGIQGNLYRTAGKDYAGNTWAAPVLKVSGTTKTAGTDYVINQDGTATFTAAPGATPTATFTYGKDNIFCLSLDPSDLVIAEQMPLTVEQNLAAPVTTDSIPLRVKQYSVLAVRNPKAHLLASGVTLPTVANF